MTSNNPQHALSERGRAFLANVEASCLHEIRKVTVPVFGIQDDTIKHDRTAVLYRIAGHHFALTASHDLHAIVGHNIPLYLSMNMKGVDPLPLGEARFYGTEATDRDVAAIWIPPDIAQEIGKHRGFLQHNQIHLNVAQPGQPFFFFGYPMGWSGRRASESEIVSVGLAFATFEHQGERDSEAIYRPEVHMLLTYTKEAVNLSTGEADTLPSIKGISGCGIWQVGDRSQWGLQPRNADNVTLVAIEHTNRPAYGYIQATRVGFLLDVIAQHFPEAKRAMSLAYPGAQVL